MQLTEVRDEPHAQPGDAFYMRLALTLAADALVTGEIPIGAVVVRDGQVVGRAHNAPIALQDPSAHAEVLALRDAARWAQNYRLPGMTLYVTVEPCLMCVGALIHARVTRVVFGCWEPKGGALGSVYQLGTDRRANHRLQVCGGVEAEAARLLLQQFFRARRGA